MKYLFIAVLTVALAAAQSVTAATVVLPLTDLEPQYASQLCWAAADVIAVNSFFPGSCVAGATAGRTSQAVEAAYNELGITSLAAVPAASPSALSSMLHYCETNIQICNRGGFPILPGLTFQTGSSVTGLTWAQAKQQIDNGHPFIFIWDYSTATGSGSHGGSQSQPDGLHALVAMGYSDDSGENQLVIWDPWPVPEMLPSTVPACGPADVGISMADLEADHEKSIPFSLYANPVSDMGITAVHGSDQYNLSVGAGAGAVPEPPGNLQINLEKRGASMQERQHHEGTRTVGSPMSVIALELDDLRSSRPDARKLLQRKVAAELFPVESNGRVVDAFLMIFRDGSWVREGYANTGVTRLLVKARDAYAKERGLAAKNFYVVAVPGRATFFAAYGRSPSAVLIPASSDPSIGAEAGKATVASAQLKRIAAAIRRDDRPKSGRPSGSS
jgi:hypothetical protein